MTSTKRHVVRASLRVETPFRIGSAESTPLSDAPILRDGRGRILIEGTSLAGVCKGFLERETRYLQGGLDAVASLFGADAASRLSMDGVVLEDATSRTRDHVGIDRRHRSACDKVKFDAEVVVAGQEFDMWMSIRPVESQDHWLLLILRDALRDGRLYLGGRSSVGNGRLSLQSWKEAQIDLAEVKTLRRFLLRRSRWDWIKESLAEPVVTEAAALPWPWTSAEPLPFERPNSIVIDWRLDVRDPLIVRESLSDRYVLSELGVRTKKDGATVDHGPYREPSRNAPKGVTVLLAGLDRSRQFQDLVLPGSSARGSLRSRAEKILRTLADKHVARSAACDPLEMQEGEPLESCASRWQRHIKQHSAAAEDPKQIHDHLCLACRTFGSAPLHGRVRVEDLRPSEDSRVVLKLLDHLAVDRFVSGAASGRKFNALAIVEGSFKGRISVEGVEPWQIGLLAQVFRDLWDEDLPIGAATSRGYARVRAWPTKVRARWPQAAWEPLEALTGAAGQVEPRGPWKGLTWDPAKPLDPFWAVLGDAVARLAEKFPNAQGEA